MSNVPDLFRNNHQTCLRIPISQPIQSHYSLRSRSMMLSLLFCSFLARTSTSPIYSVINVSFLIASSAITIKLTDNSFAVPTLECHLVLQVTEAWSPLARVSSLPRTQRDRVDTFPTVTKRRRRYQEQMALFVELDIVHLPWACGTIH